MDSVRQGLREDALRKDTYERLVCVACETQLDTETDPDEIGSRRVCPDCGRAWQQLP